MLGLAPFAGAPFSSVLQFTSDVPVSGLVATTILNNVGVANSSTINITGLQATASVGNINSGKGPVMWTSVITLQ